MASPRTISGPCEIRILRPVNNPTYTAYDPTAVAGAAQFTRLFVEGSTIIRTQQQLEDAELTLERDQFEHKTQLSSRPVRYVVTGFEPKLKISIADVQLAQLLELFGRSEDNPAETYAVPFPNAATAVKAAVPESAGFRLAGNPIVILPTPVPASLDVLDWSTLINVAPADEEYLKSVIILPNAAITDINGSNLAYGLQTQQKLQVTFTGQPYWGSATAINANSGALGQKPVRVLFGNDTYFTNVAA